jgi:hypothetical protein
MLIFGPLLHLFNVFVQRGVEMWTRAYFRCGSLRVWTADAPGHVWTSIIELITRVNMVS